MPDPSEALRIRFGAFRFDERSGELWRGEDGEESVARLPPQASRLLSHLIARRPHVVTREEIRQLLWPDVEVDFEQSLHTCIRKIRAGLGDPASAPRYIQTIPRRGYRFVGPVEPDAGAAPRPGTSTSRRPLGYTLAVGVALVLIVASVRFGTGPPDSPTRIAVMPFEPTGEASVLRRGNDIAESIVHLLTTRSSPAAEIIGPTTTRLYDGRPHGVRELIEELDLDYVVNARETTGESGARLLVELIRARDGAHIWVRYLDELPPGQDTAETIAQAVAEGAL